MKSLVEYILESQYSYFDEKIESVSKDFLDIIDLCVKNREKGKVSWGYESFVDEKLHKIGSDLCQKVYSELMSSKGKITWNEANCKRLLGTRNKSREPKANPRPEYFLIMSYQKLNNGDVYRCYVIKYNRSLGYTAQLKFLANNRVYLNVSEDPNLTSYTREDKEENVRGAMFPISEETFKNLTKIKIY